jgi:hypothetical protein
MPTGFPIFEAVMLVCFGMAWPVSIWKSWRSRTNKGKSVFFLLIVFIGYLSGLVHKLWWQEHVDGVVWLYLLNAAMVVTDIALYYRNDRLERRKRR